MTQLSYFYLIYKESKQDLSVLILASKKEMLKYKMIASIFNGIVWSEMYVN
jgi:hypothetical protein